MLLGERDAQIMLGDRGETEPAQPQHPRGDLGVEQGLRRQANVGESGQVLQRVV